MSDPTKSAPKLSDLAKPAAAAKKAAAPKKSAAPTAKKAAAKKGRPRRDRAVLVAERQAQLDEQKAKGKRFAEPITRKPHLTFANTDAKGVKTMYEVSGLNYLEAVPEVPIGKTADVLHKLTRGPAVSVKRIKEIPGKLDAAPTVIATYDKYEPGDTGLWACLALVHHESTTDVKFNLPSAK